MTTAEAWAPELQRARAARGFEVMVAHARSTNDPGRMLAMIGPPGRLTDDEVSDMLVEAGLLSLDHPRVLASIGSWRPWFADVAAGASDTALSRADEVLRRVGHGASEDRYWLALLALAWFTEAGADEIRREMLVELREQAERGV